MLRILFFLLFISFSATAQHKVDPQDYRQSYNYGKSVAVFGGSVSVIPASDRAKVIWKRCLNMKITN